MGVYYANPGNKFWKVLLDTDLTRIRLEPSQYRNLCTYRIGLTDLVKRAAGPDRDIDVTQNDRDVLASKIMQFKPKVLAFNGKRAAESYLKRRVTEYGEQVETIGDTLIYVLPSTSSAARRWWDTQHWHHLALLLNNRF